MAEKIYGVDITKPVTPLQAREAVLKCFFQAHKEVLNDMIEYGEFKDKEDLEHMQKLDVELMVKNFFKEAKADFENPTKESLTKVCDMLADYAKHFRNKKIVTKHYREIMKILKKIE